MWQIIVLSLYSLSMFFIIIFSIGQLALLVLFFRRKKQTPGSVRAFSTPHITVQLPVYNEPLVIGRLLEAVFKLDYPKNNLEIQILDDSTDETSDICKRYTRELTIRGFDVQYLHRTNRNGFKAGALQDGLLRASGEFLVIFDADFIPQPDFIKRTLVHFSTENIGLVQTRWGHLNGSQSWLTRIQEMGLNGHFSIDQETRDKSGLFINFNGTAGIWRTSCIIDSGGWQVDTLTEDLDLSYRAQMKGWKLRYCPEVVTPAELPAALTSIKSQQFRWIKGGVETSRKLLSSLWKCDVALRVKVFGSLHLLSNSVYMFIFLTSILSLPALIIKNISPEFDLFFKIIRLFFSIFAINAVYCFITIRADAKGFKESLRVFAALFPMAILFSMGMSYHNSTAIWQGIRGNKSSFVRTPKTGSQKPAKGSSISPLNNNVTSELPEMLLLAYFLFGVVVAIYFNDPGFLLYQLMMCLSYGLILYYAFQQPVNSPNSEKKTAMVLNPIAVKI
jgi:cellulose synthase/poly-beta-1,6-N-acetylglucosamine synthase-like glycosyltransferase